MAREDKDGTYRGDIQIAGRRYRRRGFLTKFLAEAWERARLEEHQRRVAGIRGNPEVTVEELVEQYLDYYRERKSDNSVTRESNCLRHWLDFFGEVRVDLVRHIQRAHLLEYLTWQRERRTWAHSTLNAHLAALARVLRWAEEYELITDYPLPKRLPFFRERPVGVPRYLTLDELAAIEEEARARHEGKSAFAEAIAILARTGMRVSELCQLTVSDLDFDRRRILVRAETTKSQTLRVVPIPISLEPTLRALAARAQAAGRWHLVYTAGGGPMDRVDVWKNLRRVLDSLAKSGRLNPDGVNVHTLRKTYISHMIMAGVDPAKVMAIVGHKEWATIRRYLVLSPEYALSGGEELPY